SVCRPFAGPLPLARASALAFGPPGLDVALVALGGPAVAAAAVAAAASRAFQRVEPRAQALHLVEQAVERARDRIGNVAGRRAVGDERRRHGFRGAGGLHGAPG